VGRTRAYAICTAIEGNVKRAIKPNAILLNGATLSPVKNGPSTSSDRIIITICVSQWRDMTKRIFASIPYLYLAVRDDRFLLVLRVRYATILVRTVPAGYDGRFTRVYVLERVCTRSVGKSRRRRRSFIRVVVCRRSLRSSESAVWNYRSIFSIPRP